MANGTVQCTLCDVHKQQMPFMPFMPFKLLETTTTATTRQCMIQSGHGMASRYCKKCGQALCDKCAFDHASHGAADITMVQQEVAKQLAGWLHALEVELQQSMQLNEKARDALKAAQTVSTSRCNISRVKNYCKHRDSYILKWYVQQ